MAFPRKSPSGEIDLFCIDHMVIKQAASSPLTIQLSDDSPVRARRYHSVQLAIVTSFFACGGFLCSLFFLDGGDDFPQPHHWLRSAYRSPVIVSRPPSSGTRVIPPNVSLGSNSQEKPVSQRRQINHGKVVLAQPRTDSPSSGFRPALDLRTKWTSFSEYLRDRAESFNSARLRALELGRRLRECHLEAGRLSTPNATDKKNDDPG